MEPRLFNVARAQDGQGIMLLPPLDPTLCFLILTALPSLPHPQLVWTMDPAVSS